MEWCSKSCASKKFKKNQMRRKSLLYHFIEYALDERDGEIFDREDSEFTNWLTSQNINTSDEFWYLTSKLDVRIAPRTQLTDDIKSNKSHLRAMHAFNNNIKYAQLAYKLRKVLGILMDCNDNVYYTNDDGQTILHVFLKECITKRNPSKDQMTRIRKLMNNLIIERGASLYFHDKDEKTPLDIAMKSENIELLELMISTLTNVNERDEHGNTVLHIVMKHCVDEIICEDIIRTLLSRGADVNGKNKRGITAVHLASEKWQVKLLQLFANCSGADFNLRTNDNESPLHIACQALSQCYMNDISRVIRVITLLIGHGCDIGDRDRCGCMPLHYAAEFGEAEIVEKLIELGASVDCQTKKLLMTPLHLAAKADRLDIMKKLVELGANVNAEGVDGATPIFVAALLGSYKSMQYLMDHGADLYRRERVQGFTLLHMVSYVVDSNKSIIDSEDSGIDLKMTDDNVGAGRKLTKLDVIVDKDFDVNDPGYCGVSPLHLATMTSNYDAVTVLIERGANVNFQSSEDEFTALHMASFICNLNIVKILIEHGADTNCTGGLDQVTPLHLCLMANIDWNLGKYPSCVQTNDINKSIVTHCWPKWSFTKPSVGDNDVALMLIDNGANVNAKNACKKTALHLATLELDVDVVERLLKSNAQTNVQDLDGRLPLQNILENASIQGLKLLLDHGADVNDSDISELIINDLSIHNDLRNLVIEHVIKFKLIGLPIAKIYEPLINAPTFENFTNLCSTEARMLMNYQDSGFSPYRFLHINSKFQCSFIKKFARSFETLAEPFPIYSHVIQAACREAINRNSLLELARNLWNEITLVYLPDVCVEYILSYLNNRYLELFVSSPKIGSNNNVEKKCRVFCGSIKHTRYVK